MIDMLVFRIGEHGFDALDAKPMRGVANNIDHFGLTGGAVECAFLIGDSQRYLYYI